MELAMEDERVEGTRVGVAVLDVMPRLDVLLRSFNRRDRDGNRLSILLAMLLTGESPDFCLFAIC